MLWTRNECKSDDSKMFAAFILYFFAFYSDLSQKSVAKLVTQVSVEFPGGTEAQRQQQTDASYLQEERTSLSTDGNGRESKRAAE